MRLNLFIGVILICISTVSCPRCSERGSVFHLPTIPEKDPLLVSILRDMVLVNRDIFTFNSFKIISTVFPPYVFSRMIDDDFHSCFYDDRCHRNINQVPSWAPKLMDTCTTASIIALGSLAFISPNEEVRLTSRVFLEGLPFVLLAKDVIKEFQTNINVRPKNGCFKKRRCYGGFPSGHMSLSMYMTVLYGLRFGPNFAIPLSFVSLGVFVASLNCNRHYISQLIAGAGLGAMYACAANSVVDYNLNRDCSLSLAFDNCGGPGLSLAFRF